MIFCIGLDRCLVHRAHRRAEVAPRPHMLSPIPLPQVRKFCLQMSRRSSLAILRQFRRRQNWRCPQQQMNMVRRYCASYDYNVPRLADLPDQIARARSATLPRRISYRYFVHQIMWYFRSKTACALFLYSVILPILAGIKRLEADRVKGGGIRPGGRSKAEGLPFIKNGFPRGSAQRRHLLTSVNPPNSWEFPGALASKHW